MRRTYRYALALLALALIIGANWQVGLSQSENAEFFPQTRHTVEGAFLDFYLAAANPELVYGYPITEAFSGREGFQVQYFQRARFEFQPGRGIQLTPLGSLHYQPGRTTAEFNTSAAACRNFSTGFQVCSVFLTFFEEHGGRAQFGNPISSIEQDGLRYVQYFEYTRLEWYPDHTDPRLEVQVGPLGRLYFDLVREDPGRLRPLDSANIIEITTLRVHAFPAIPALSGSGTQTVFVIVQDQTYTSISGATVDLHVTFPSGQVLSYRGTTNENGYVRVPLAIDLTASGTGPALVEATGASAGLSWTTQTSFRINP